MKGWRPSISAALLGLKEQIAKRVCGLAVKIRKLRQMKLFKQWFKTRGGLGGYFLGFFIISQYCMPKMCVQSTFIYHYQYCTPNVIL